MRLFFLEADEKKASVEGLSEILKKDEDGLLVCVIISQSLEVKKMVDSLR